MDPPLPPAKRRPAGSRRPQPFWLRGSLITLRRRCGKPACHCAQGSPHASPALSWSRRGKTQILTLPAAWRAQARAALRRYRRAEAHLKRQAERSLRWLARRLRAGPQRSP